jgi:hypothetical protein
MVATFTIESEILVYIEKERVCVLFLRTICFSNSGKPQLAPPSLPDALILQLLCHTTTGKIECGRHNVQKSFGGFLSLITNFLQMSLQKISVVPHLWIY